MTGLARRPSWLSSLFLVASFGARTVAWSKRTIFMVVLLLLPAIIGVIIRSEAPPGTAPQYLRTVAPTLHLGLVALLCLFYGGSIVRDAIEDKTLGFLLTRPLGRVRVLFGLYLGMVLFVLPLVLAAGATTFSCCRAGLSGGVFGNESDVAGLIGMMKYLAVASLLYSALFSVLGMAVKHPTIIGLALLIVFEGVLATIPGPIRLFAPSTYLDALLPSSFETRSSAIAQQSRSSSGVVSPERAALVISTLMAVSLILIARIAKRADFTGAEKPPS